MKSAAVHCAAVYAYGVHNHAEVSTVNIDGTRMLIDAAKDAGVRRVIVTSSSVTSGSSADSAVRDERYRIGNEYAPPYFLSKVRQEQVALQAAINLGANLDVTAIANALANAGANLAATL